MKNLGVLCHISSLPSEYGIGDFGASSFKFVDYLKTTPVKLWQILPLNPTNQCNCPYGTMCSFTFDEMFCDPMDLVKTYGINKNELITLKSLENTTLVNYKVVKAEKIRLLTLAYELNYDNLENKLLEFSKARPDMLLYCYYRVLLNFYSVFDWRKVPKEYWDITGKSAVSFKKQHSYDINKFLFFQYVLTTQWQKVKTYANKNGIKILGDMPIYFEPNAVDVFAHTEYLQLDKNYNPKVNGGVPPDDFNANGQNWGTCVYDWDKLKKDNYSWILNRIKLLLTYYDMLRLDHFAGLVDHYEINPANPSLNKWVKGGGMDLFNVINKECGLNNIVVEDLGETREECVKVKNAYNLKGMKILQFGFNENGEHNLPENVLQNTIYYLGTHDNNTFMGFLNQADKTKLEKVKQYLGVKKLNKKKALVSFINKMLECKCDTVVLQIQDYLMQNEKHRINYPGQAENCWEYRVPKKYEKQFNKTLKKLNVR